MIASLEGTLLSVRQGRARVRCGAITYELLVPAADEARLAQVTGAEIAFETLHYLEAHGQGSSMIPRLVGFGSADDRAFFELFTTVKGLGAKKALRALALPFPTIAGAIANRDVDLLKSLPEIGKRTAESIVAELSGKVDGFIEVKLGGGAAPTDGGAALDGARTALCRDVINVLTELGETRLAAVQLVDRALTADRTIETAEVLLQAALRLRG
jgi:Holliday junction DNA helicase RuvA